MGSALRQNRWTGLLFVCASAVSCSSAAWTVAPRNTLAIDTSAVSGVSELSGAVYRGPIGGVHEILAVQDSGNQFIALSFNLATNGSLISAVATAKRSLSPGFDFEGIALGPAGSVLIAEESTPAVRRYDLATGAATALLSMPVVYSSSRSNFAFESLTRVPSSSIYWTANEAALTVDGALANTSQGTMVRLQQFSYDGTGALVFGPQYAYPVDPIHVGTTTDSNTRSGLVDLVALPDSSLLALERSLGLGLPPYESRIYHINLNGASDVSQVPFHTGLIGQSYTPVTKTLLWEGQVGGAFGQNMEGLALGPQLAGGDWTLLGVVDNGGSGSNTLASFVLSPTVTGDFNGDGRADAGDYVVWRRNLSSPFATSDYSLWRSHYGKAAGTGAGLPAGDTINVPEAPVTFITLCWIATFANFQRRPQLA